MLLNLWVKADALEVTSAFPKINIKPIDKYVVL